ncbi:glycosyltransferase family 2 protein [Vibrio sp. YYF0003]|uniref:glycosyltransferase family 2 protein n=1 Tax=Vibrio sp. YYF0003 TaxID=3116646 RepID=UPI002EC29053|nr:glycosyltransferase family 2 protein [Vibrio sp. YYF0003]
MNNITISVVIPTYNSSSTISEALQSVIEQQFDTNNVYIEIVIIDDGSKDQECLNEKIKNFKCTNSNVNIVDIYLPENVGGGEARNIGIKESSGDYVSFLDSDDIWLCDKISHQLKIYNESSVLTGKVIKGKNINCGTILPLLSKKENEYVSDALFLSNKLIQTSTFFMSKKIALDILFNPKLPRHQDYDFLLRAECLGYKIIQDDKPVSFWRVEDASSNRFLKKKASPEFFICWFNEYKKYMTKESQISYVSKNIFSACMITKKINLFFKFLLFGNFKLLEVINVFFNIIKWRLEKIFL